MNRNHGGRVSLGLASLSTAATPAPLLPIMIALTLITIIFQVRSISAMTTGFATAPLGLIEVIPTLLLFNQRFGIARWSR